MIQRIQSFYLLIVTGLLITAMCLPMGYFIDTTGEHPFKALGIDVNGIFQSTWGISVSYTHLTLPTTSRV